MECFYIIVYDIIGYEIIYFDIKMGFIIYLIMWI